MRWFVSRLCSLFHEVSVTQFLTIPAVVFSHCSGQEQENEIGKTSFLQYTCALEGIYLPGIIVLFFVREGDSLILLKTLLPQTP